LAGRSIDLAGSFLAAIKKAAGHLLKARWAKKMLKKLAMVLSALKVQLTGPKRYSLVAAPSALVSLSSAMSPLVSKMKDLFMLVKKIKMGI